MPVLQPQRQPERSGVLAWFREPAAHALLGAEGRAMERVLAGVPALPWLRCTGVEGVECPHAESGRGLHLYRTGRGFEGALRCGLPWPLASETFGAVLLQHALDGGDDTRTVLDECMRILAPGGVLWLAALNPWSPYRARWWRAGLAAHGPGYWQAALARAGFPAGAASLQWLGPRWRLDDDGAGISAADRLRAGIALTVSKRVRAAIPPNPVRRLRLQTGLGSARTHAGVLRQAGDERR